MAESNNRDKNRDSLFLMAELVFADNEEPVKVRVRNLSAGGLMGDGLAGIERGTEMLVFLRNIKAVHGKIAWVADGRFGVAFDKPIDPKAVIDKPAAEETHIPRFARPIKSVSDYKGVIRKI